MLMRILPAVLTVLSLSVTPVLAEGPSPPGPKDRCGVCGMFVAPFTNWVSVIQFKNGDHAYFDGPRDLFTYLSDLEKFRPGTKAADVSGVYVTEYYSTKLVTAEEVFFVTGSDVMGPMGSELVPIRGRDQAETFKRDHSGKKIMRFDGKELHELSSAQ